MYTSIIVLIIIVCVLLVLVVLVQNSKGGGLAANFQSSNAMMGVRKTADFLEKATWTLAAALILLSILASSTINKGDIDNKTRIEDQISNQPASGPIDNTMIPGTAGQYPEENEEE
jgi:preprotein translocase subunit SecG